MESQNTSLTAPADRTDEKYVPGTSTPLTDTEMEVAMKALSDTSIIDKFPRVERTYADPAINMQNFTLFSFIPAKGATPDKDGVFGMAKVRGSYGTVREAAERTDYLIRNHDSYHKIYTAYVGRPFPVTVSDKYSAEKSEIDIRKKQTEIISDDIKAKKEEEKRNIDDMKEREKQLLDQAKPDHVADPLEQYTVTRVKKAQLIWTYFETKKKMDEMKESIIKVREEIKKIDEETPEFSKKFFDKYMDARTSAGITEEKSSESFMKYMVEDIEVTLDF